jgi:hypothetical protein
MFAAERPGLNRQLAFGQVFARLERRAASDAQ